MLRKNRKKRKGIHTLTHTQANKQQIQIQIKRPNNSLKKGRPKDNVVEKKKGKRRGVGVQNDEKI